MQCILTPGRLKGGQIGELEETPGLSAGAWQIRPLSRGYVEARSNQPGDMPAINPLSLRGKRPAGDHRRIANGAADLRRTPARAIRPGRDSARQPDPERRRIARLCAAQRRHLLSRQLHLHDGEPRETVVVDELRVDGLDGLRVIDASVMPAVTSTNTNAPTIMIAEKVATMIKTAVRQKLAA
jgi:choline dehydrogenase